MTTGSIILCGGRSTRMGRDKATLPFGPELMLQRVVRLLSQVVDTRNIVVVAAPGQSVPPLPTELSIAHDQAQERGPLEGIAAGLRAIPPGIDAVYITSCDVPLLVPGFVMRMFASLDDYEVVVPRDAEHVHPLAAVYRTSLLPLVQKHLDADRLRPRALFDECRTRYVDVDELREVDPELQTLVNLNNPDDYEAAIRSAGLSSSGIRGV